MTTKKMTTSIEKLTLFLLSACALSRVNSAPPREVKIGMLLSWSSKSVPAYRYAGAVTRAIDDINNSTQILPGINVTYVQGDIACNARRTGVTVDLFNRGVDVFIGPPCYKDCLWGGLLSSYEKIPMISFGCSSERLSNKKEYTYFARTKPFARTSKTYTPKAFAQVMHRFNWKRACIVVSDSDVYTPIALATLDEFERQNFTSFYEKYFEEYSTFEDKKYILQKLNKTCRIFVFLMERKSIMDFAVQAYHLGWMQTNKYAFIHMDFEFDKMTEADMEKWKVDKETMYHKVLEGIISISNTRPNTSDLEYNRFREDVVRRLKDDFGSTTITEQNSSVSSSAAYLYDATMLYARGLTSVLLENANASLRDAKLIYEHMKMQSFEGITGHVKVDEFGDRIPQYEIINVHNGTYNKILAYDPLKNNSAHMMMDLDSTVYFVGGFTTPPIDDPCGRNNEFCKVEVPKDIDLFPPLIGAAVGVLVLVLIVSAYLYNKRKYEMEILRKGVIINMKEVALSAKSNNNNSGNVSFKASVRSNKSGTSHFSTFSKTRLGPYFNKGGGGSRVVVYRANLYFMKVVNMCKVEFNKETLMTLKHMKDLNSANINTFVGIATQGPDCHLFWNHCSKGSLQDILQNDEIDCDWLFRISFAKDIVKGLHEIQRSPLGYHGNLNSSNCLIDNRWVCKLSNFGTKRFPDGLKKHAANTYEEYKTSFWHAPEKLTRSLDHSEAQADVYSYGVILYEICTRGDPYALELEQGLEPRDIIENVKTQHDFRPVIPTGIEAPAHYAELMQRCWKHEPQQRPSLRDITKAIMKMEKSNGIKGGLVDHMLLMMEKYANNLEDLVAERTDQLQNEKQKTEALLYKMLPVSVANRLKEGQPVGAESFDSVTIFFSDIVGFTKICSDSTPLQVVEMLNDLYICFDNCIDMYDVYKVETIGDAYMVVSGIPIRNGLRHAGEIATMSLDLLSCVKTFEIKHKPQTQMQLRVGMHTGSCVAGVVGLKMPRYCLFGDTVNYASRMESSGLALRVHVSPECKQALDQLGGYHLQERGAVEMKGKGTITTFFLTGKQGFDKELPDTRLAASLEDHTFK